MNADIFFEMDTIDPMPELHFPSEEEERIEAELTVRFATPEYLLPERITINPEVYKQYCQWVSDTICDPILKDIFHDATKNTFPTLTFSDDLPGIDPEDRYF